MSYFKNSKLGEIEKAKMQRIYDLYNVMGLTTESINIDDFIYYDRKIENLKFTEEEKQYLMNKKEIRACIVSNYMPYSDIQNGKFVGAISDFMKLVENKLEIAIFPVETKSFSQSLQYLKDKKCNVSYSKER